MYSYYTVYLLPILNTCVQFTVQVLEKSMAEYWHYMPERVVLDTSNMVIAPMPGVVKSVAVKVGDMVSQLSLHHW